MIEKKVVASNEKSEYNMRIIIYIYGGGNGFYSGKNKGKTN